MTDWTQIILTILATVGAIMTGFFALIRYFLKHLEKKNGHIERIASDFNKTVTNHIHDAGIKSAEQNKTFEHLISAIEKLLNKL